MMTLKSELMVILCVYMRPECRNWWDELADVEGCRKLLASAASVGLIFGPFYHSAILLADLTLIEINTTEPCPMSYH